MHHPDTESGKKKERRNLIPSWEGVRWVCAMGGGSRQDEKLLCRRHKTPYPRPFANSDGSTPNCSLKHFEKYDRWLNPDW